MTSIHGSALTIIYTAHLLSGGELILLFVIRVESFIYVTFIKNNKNRQKSFTLYCFSYCTTCIHSPPFYSSASFFLLITEKNEVIITITLEMITKGT